MSAQGFHLYSGGYTQTIPCEVYDYVFGDLNYSQAAKIVADVNRAYDEVWWWYPSGGSAENDRYVIWNYRENHWSIGTRARAGWHDGNGVVQYPLGCDITRVEGASSTTATGYIYRHEFGFLDDGSTRFASGRIRSGPLEIGDRVGTVTQVITDEETNGSLDLTFYKRFTPNTTETSTTYTVDSDGYTDVRETARQFVVEFSPVADTDYRVGDMRFDVRTRGKR